MISDIAIPAWFWRHRRKGSWPCAHSPETSRTFRINSAELRESSMATVRRTRNGTRELERKPALATPTNPPGRTRCRKRDRRENTLGDRR
jgi:hypothetical protein